MAHKLGYKNVVRLSDEVHLALLKKQAEIYENTGEKITFMALAQESILIGLKEIKIEPSDSRQTQLNLEEENGN